MLRQFLTAHQKTIKKVLNVFVLFGIALTLSILSMLWTEPSIIVIQNEFLMNFIGIILGLAISLLTFIYSSFDKIHDTFVKKSNDEIKNRIQVILKNTFKELIQDTYFVMLIFGFFILILLLQDTNIPFVKWQFNLLSKNDFFNLCKYFSFFSVCIAIFDMIISLFKMMETIDFSSERK